MNECSKTVVRRWFEEVWNQRRTETIDELMSDESVCYGEDGPLRGAAEFRQKQYHPFLSAFPDLIVTIEALLGDGDQVVVRWSASGTHTNEGLGIQATNSPVTFQGITWIRVQDGKFREGWQHSNIPQVVRQLHESV